MMGLVVWPDSATALDDSGVVTPWAETDTRGTTVAVDMMMEASVVDGAEDWAETASTEEVV